MKEQILIIDDDPLVLESLSLSIKNEGYPVSTANSAHQALDCLNSHKFDLILTDLVLEEDNIGGLEILEEVRKISPETVVMVITGYGSLSTAIEALRRGAFDYILKPADDQELKFRIKRGLDKRRLERERDAVTKELKDVVSIVAHDLKSPLTPLIGYADFLVNHYTNKLDDEALELLSKIKYIGENMADMVENLLLFSGIGRTRCKNEYIELYEFIEYMCETIAKKYSKEATPSFKIDNKIPPIKGDRTNIYHIFMNLLDNAVKYNHNHAEIEIGFMEFDELERKRIAFPFNKEEIISPEKYYIFYIEDNGIGIHESDINKVFEIFTRLHDKKKYKGTGIGLAIVKKMVELYEGKIWLTSKKGVGTIFYFMYPKDAALLNI